MRFQYRLRTALIAVAVFGLILALLVGIGPFLQYHAAAYNFHAGQALFCRTAIAFYQPHAAPGHSCPFCRRYFRRPVAVLIAIRQRQLREHERMAWWHGLLSAPYWWFGGKLSDDST